MSPKRTVDAASPGRQMQEQAEAASDLLQAMANTQRLRVLCLLIDLAPMDGVSAEEQERVLLHELGAYRPDLLERAFGRTPALPRVLGPAESAGTSTTGAQLGPGTGDNAAAALGLAAEPGDVVLSVGTSGVVSIVSLRNRTDPSPNRAFTPPVWNP